MISPDFIKYLHISDDARVHAQAVTVILRDAQPSRNPPSWRVFKKTVTQIVTQNQNFQKNQNIYSASRQFDSMTGKVS